MDNFWQFWEILGNFGQFWAILGNFGQFLDNFWVFQYHCAWLPQQPYFPDCASVEFGFDVNVLDFIGNSELNDDDDAIISFVANNTNHKSSVLDSPESGIGSMMSNPDSSCVNAAISSAGVIKTSTCPPQEPPINDAVNIPNYAQVVQFITKQWKQVQKELKQGLVHQF